MQNKRGSLMTVTSFIIEPKTSAPKNCASECINKLTTPPIGYLMSPLQGLG